MTANPGMLRSCVTGGRNCATFNQTGATPPATATQQKNKISLKALADAVVKRNHERNQCATKEKNMRNFLSENDPDKLRTLPLSCTEKNSDKERGSSKLSISPIINQVDGLHPCSLCGGNLFNEGSRGGYFCVECQGLTEGAIVARVVCGVTPRKRNVQCNAKGVTRVATIASTYKTSAHQQKPSPLAVAWLKDKRQVLKAAGWTARELYRRNKSKGLVWEGIWNKEALTLIIKDDGVIAFQFPTVTGQMITQTTRPQKLKSRR
jgi:hypothetical protein